MRGARGIRAGPLRATCKLVILGASDVGKTALLDRFINRRFLESSESTIGAVFRTQSIVLDDGTTVAFNCWDTAGQERYASIAPLYYRDSQVGLCCYDITSRKTYDRAKDWIRELQRAKVGVIGLVGTKADLAAFPERRQVPRIEAMTYAEELDCIFLETSAKTGEGVAEVFVECARHLPSVVAATAVNAVRLDDIHKPKPCAC